MSSQPTFGVVPDHVMTLLEGMSLQKRQQVFDFVEFLDCKQMEDEGDKGVKESRILGLHAGQGWVSDDFDQPLSDELWL